MDETINRLSDAAQMLALVANAADAIASGTADDPVKLAGNIRQVAWTLTETIGDAVEALEVAQRI